MDTLRISDADRATAVDQLGEQYSLGRLTKDEFDERSDAVWSARTRGDLVPVFADLPVHAPGDSLAQVPEQSYGHTPARGAVPASRGWRRSPIPIAPVLLALLALTVLTHVPFLLLGLLGWFLLSRRYGVASPSWSRRHAHRR